MKKHRQQIRTLALEIRSGRVAFAVLEGAAQLLESGIRRWQSDANPAKSAMERIHPLLALYSPGVVVLKKLGSDSKSKKRRNVTLAVKWNLAKCFIEVHMIERNDVRNAFRQSGSKNKYLIADAIVQMFPELKWKLPQKRRAWQPERYNTAIFDAVALALTCRSLCAVSENSQDS
jgi:hypothetical protein